MNESNEVDPKITYEWIARADLTVDARVQRDLYPPRVRRIVEDFTPAGLGTIVVSRRDDGTNIVLDGRHRCAAAEQTGYTGKMHCEVHHGLSLKDEARMFLTLNSQTVPAAISKFLVRITAGDHAALEIEAILSSHGWRIGTGSAAGYLNAVTAIENVYRNAGRSKPNGQYPDLTDRVIGVITAAWGTDYRGANGQILLGLAQLFGRFGDAVNVGKLVREMQALTPASLVGTAKALQSAQGGGIPAAIAKVLVGKHNHKMRINLLPEWVWTR